MALIKRLDKGIRLTFEEMDNNLEHLKSLAESSTTTEATYTELTTLVNNNELVTGNFYLLTDYQTMYYQPDYDVNGDLKSTMAFKTESVEPLLLLSTSENTFDINAYSPNYPKDKIQYDFTIDEAFDYGGLVATQSIKGRIIERIDEWNNRTDYDHRTVKFLRYDDGNGDFTLIFDNSNASQEFLTFGDLYGDPSSLIVNNYIGDIYKFSIITIRFDTGLEFGNNVFHSEFCFSNTIGYGFYSNTIGNSFTSNTIGDNFNSNTIGYGFYSNTIGKNFFSNTIGNDFYSNTIGYGFNLNTIGESFYSNTIGESFYSNTIGDSFRSNTIKSYINNLDFTTTPATHVYQNYDCEIFKASNSNFYLKYFDGTQSQFVSPTV
jgi:hypothetical protein